MFRRIYEFILTTYFPRDSWIRDLQFTSKFCDTFSRIVQKVKEWEAGSGEFYSELGIPIVNFEKLPQTFMLIREHKSFQKYLIDNLSRITDPAQRVSFLETFSKDFCVPNIAVNRWVSNHFYNAVPLNNQSIDHPSVIVVNPKNRVITRSFSLLPLTQTPQKKIRAYREERKIIYKKLTDYFGAFRALENLYIQIMIKAFKEKRISLNSFSGTSVQFVHKNIYMPLNLANYHQSQFKNSIKLKERIHRNAITLPYQAVRNWIIRAYNLRFIISTMAQQFSKLDSFTTKDVVRFFLGKTLSNEFLKILRTTLSQNCFKEKQNFSYYFIENMLNQIKNLFFKLNPLAPVLTKRVRAIKPDIQLNKKYINDFINTCLNDFTRKKKHNEIKTTISELPNYFLDLYFRMLKNNDTLKQKKTKNTDKHSLKQYITERNTDLDRKKEMLKIQLKERFDSQKLHKLMTLALQNVLTEISTNPNIIITKYIFSPFFSCSKISTLDINGFQQFFTHVFYNKVRERLKELFLTEDFLRFFLDNLRYLKNQIFVLLNNPKLEGLTMPINAKKKFGCELNFDTLTATLSFKSRKFLNFKITDKKKRIASLIKEGAIPKPPILSFRNRKLILNLPFEVEKGIVSKESNTQSIEREIRVDLGLIHFAVVSVQEKDFKRKFSEIDRYFIGSHQLFNLKWDSDKGKFVKRNNFDARKNSNIKLKLIHLRNEIKNHQRLLNEYENRCIQSGINPKKKLKYNKLSRSISILWNRVHNINREIARLVSHNLIEIAKFHHASRIVFEDLRFSKHSKKRKVGKNLAFWQVQWLFSQIQEAVKLQAYLNDIRFRRVSAAYTSQRCPLCGELNKRDGKRYTCPNTYLHANNKIFHLDTDLLGARNVQVIEFPNKS